MSILSDILVLHFFSLCLQQRLSEPSLCAWEHGFCVWCLELHSPNTVVSSWGRFPRGPWSPSGIWGNFLVITARSMVLCHHVCGGPGAATVLSAQGRPSAKNHLVLSVPCSDTAVLARLQFLSGGGLYQESGDGLLDRGGFRLPSGVSVTTQQLFSDLRPTEVQGGRVSP